MIQSPNNREFTDEFLTYLVTTPSTHGDYPMIRALAELALTYRRKYHALEQRVATLVNTLENP